MTITTEATARLIAILSSGESDLSNRRLVAADMAEEMGLFNLEAALRTVEKQVLFWHADPDYVYDNGRVRLNLAASPLPLEGIKIIATLKRICGCKKRAFSISVSTKVQMDENYFDGGTGYDYAVVLINAPYGIPDSVLSCRYPAGAGDWMRPVQERPMEFGKVIVKTGLFCGKEVPMEVIVHPDDTYRFGLCYVSANDHLARDMARLEQLTRKAVVKVWGHIACDSAELMEGLNGMESLYVAVELCLDADRPVTLGGMTEEDYAALMRLNPNTVNGWARQALRNSKL
jgi:hypothetical protein